MANASKCKFKFSKVFVYCEIPGSIFSINCNQDWTDHYKITASKATKFLNFLWHTMCSAPHSAKSLAYKG